MRRRLRKGNEGVEIAYTNGGFSSLRACNFEVEVLENRVVLSMDFSPSERVRNKDSNLYSDVVQLIEQASGVKSFAIDIDRWLDPLAAKLKQHPKASKEIEIRFKDQSRHLYQYEIASGPPHFVTFEVTKYEKVAG